MEDADQIEQLREQQQEIEAERHQEYIETQREIQFERSCGYWDQGEGMSRIGDYVLQRMEELRIEDLEELTERTTR